MARGPLSIAQITAEEAMTRQAITKHLQVLEHAGLVSGVRRGREHLWKLDPRRLEAARAYLDNVSRQWDDALERLRQAVED